MGRQGLPLTNNLSLIIFVLTPIPDSPDVWMTAENLWFLGRYMVQLTVQNIHRVNLSEVSSHWFVLWEVLSHCYHNVDIHITCMSTL